MPRQLIFAVCMCAVSACAPKNKTVRVVERVESQFTTEQGATLETRRVRAWVEDIERDAGVATLIFRAAEGQTIQSLTVSPEADIITFSLIEKLTDSDAADRGGPRLLRYSATLRSVTSKGGGVSQLTTGRWLDFNPAYGPPGFITFDSNRTRPDGRDLFRIASDRVGGVSVIRQTQEGYSYASSVGPDQATAFTFKPDYRGRGFRLEETSPQVWTIGGANAYPTQLREGSTPAISPDGRKVAFIGENGQLWTMDAGGGNQIQITSSALPKDRLNGDSMPKLHPSWTPDSKHILFAAADGKDSEQYSNYDIWVIAASGGTSQQLSTNGSSDIMPRAAPDGRWIYFVSNRGFTEGIWRIPMPRL